MSSSDRKRRKQDTVVEPARESSSDSQPHATTSDQINEMESEGQAAKPGTSEQRPQSDHTASPSANSVEGGAGAKSDTPRDLDDEEDDIGAEDAWQKPTDPGRAMRSGQDRRPATPSSETGHKPNATGLQASGG